MWSSFWSTRPVLIWKVCAPGFKTMIVRSIHRSPRSFWSAISAARSPRQHQPDVSVLREAGRSAFPGYQTPESSNIISRESFSKTVADALEQLKLVVINDPYAPNVIGNATGFQSLPALAGPGRAL